MPGDVAAVGESGDAGAIGLAMRGLVASPALIAYVRKLRAAIRAVDPDVIHSNGMKTHVLSRLIVMRHASRAAIVWHLHDLLGQRPLMGKLLRRFAGRTSAAIAVSEAVAGDAKRVLPRTPVHIVLDAIDVEHFAPGARDAARLDALAGFPAARDERLVRVGLVATYARWKGQDLFLDAAARVLRGRDHSAPPVRFYIVGGPIYATTGSQFTRDELRRRAAELRIADAVGFIDFQHDPRDVYRSLDVVVHASTSPEPFGRTIAEAMACGRATVVSNAGGAKELFTEGHDALGFIPANAADLARVIGRLIGDHNLRDRLGKAARTTAQARFDRARLAGQLDEVYRAVTSR
jgi:glycosyltransferase involved in cell wall biosynthesis